MDPRAGDPDDISTPPATAPPPPERTVAGFFRSRSRDRRALRITDSTCRRSSMRSCSAGVRGRGSCAGEVLATFTGSSCLASAVLFLGRRTRRALRITLSTCRRSSIRWSSAFVEARSVCPLEPDVLFVIALGVTRVTIAGPGLEFNSRLALDESARGRNGAGTSALVALSSVRLHVLWRGEADL